MNNKIKILIIEDEAIIAENLRYSLEDLGYQVTDTCYTFTHAINALKGTDADVVLLDINLGKNTKESGLVIAGVINNSLPLPFIFITAYNDLETIKTATRLRPSGYLIKPVNNAILFAAVQTAIERFNNNELIEPAGFKIEKPGYFFVKLGTRNHKIMWKDIYCIEAGKNYVKLRTGSNNQDYPIRGSLKYVLDNLLPDDQQKHFIRINRSIYLNKKFITGFDAACVYCGKEKFENSGTDTNDLRDLIIK